MKGDPLMELIIFEKLFRKHENEKKVEFIIANTGITMETIVKAAVVARKNKYHNFGHELGATEYGIKIAQAERLTEEQINTIALSLLMHDAGHRGIVNFYDEMRSVELAAEVLSEKDLKSTGLQPGQFIKQMRDNIFATIFDNRGKLGGQIPRIMQDADLAHLGQGIYYWAWASMGLIDEFNLERNIKLTPEDFIKIEQVKFIAFLKSLSSTESVWLSKGAREIFRDPLGDVLAFQSWSTEAINFAYEVRMEDITLEEFEIEIKKRGGVSNVPS